MASLSERTALVGASMTSLLAGLGLVGWLASWPVLATLYPGSIPMAPTTALSLLLLGGTLTLEARARSPRVTTAVALLVTILASVQLGNIGAGLPTLDALLVPHPDLFRGFPIGRMSPWTALGLLLAGFSLLIAGFPLLSVALARRSRALGAVSASFALAVSLLGAMVTLGYLFGAPLLYGGALIPMAFPTGLALACFGLALVGLTPREIGPLGSLTGTSIRARLLRAFLPVAPVIVFVGLLVGRIQGLNPALQVALTTVVSALVVAAVVSWAALSVGWHVEVAHDAMQALMFALRSPPDVIVLDIGMPGGSGFGALAKLKQSVRTEGIPVVVVSNSIAPEDEARVLGMGAVAFFRKPVEPDTLHDTLVRVTRLAPPSPAGKVP